VPHGQSHGALEVVVGLSPFAPLDSNRDDLASLLGGNQRGRPSWLSREGNERVYSWRTSRVAGRRSARTAWRRRSLAGSRPQPRSRNPLVSLAWGGSPPWNFNGDLAGAPNPGAGAVPGRRGLAWW
jgi:hypothetical protein